MRVQCFDHKVYRKVWTLKTLSTISKAVTKKPLHVLEDKDKPFVFLRMVSIIITREHLKIT